MKRLILLTVVACILTLGISLMLEPVSFYEPYLELINPSPEATANVQDGPPQRTEEASESQDDTERETHLRALQLGSVEEQLQAQDGEGRQQPESATVERREPVIQDAAEG